MRIAVFGDSIAWGMVDTGAGGWADRLKRHLLVHSTQQIPDEVLNLANSGDSTKDLLGYFDADCDSRLGTEQQYKRENVIIISIGTNDAILWENKSHKTSVAQFRQNINELIRMSKKYANNLLFIGLTPVDEALTNPVAWNADAYSSNKCIEEYNSVIRAVCAEQGVSFMDLHSDWLKRDYRRLLADGLHPNPKGHELIFRAVKNFLVKNKWLDGK